MDDVTTRDQLPHDLVSPALKWPDFGMGLAIYALTSLVAVLGVFFGHEYVPSRSRGSPPRSSIVAAFANWDGQWYKRIAEEGYDYNLESASSVAFFPAFPLTSGVLAKLTGWPTEWALLFVAHTALVATFVMLAAYVRMRFPAAPHGLSGHTLLVFGLWPTSFFFRMTYSESLFLLATVAVLCGLHRRWPLFIVALLIGFATAMRPVAVALLVPLVLTTWLRSPSTLRCALRLGWLLPVAIWGLVAYMIFLGQAFDDPLAFAHAQDFWRKRAPSPVLSHVWSLATLEPIVSVWDPVSWCFWREHDNTNSALFNLTAANPVYFVSGVVLVIVGGWRRWLNANELLLSAGLLLIPYVLRSHEMCMTSMGRFAAVVIPMYLVLGHLMCRLPPWLVSAFLALSAFVMGVYAALFAAGYRFI